MSKYNFKLYMENENSLSIIIDMMRPESIVLEFGSANGRMTKYIHEDMRCVVDIVEIDEESGSEAAKYSRNAFLGEKEGNIEQFEWYDKIKENRYDYIIFADVLEHLHDPAEVLRRVKILLSDEGVILLSVPNIAHNAILLELMQNEFPYKKVGLLDDTHIHFFTYYSLKKMIKECGYQCIKEKATYCYPKDTEFQISYDVIEGNCKKALCNREYGDVYQFVFQIADESNEYFVNRKSNTCESRFAEYEMSCYYGENTSDFSEKKCIKRYFKPGKNQFTLDLSGLDNITALRIDPMECMCIIKNFHVYEMKTKQKFKILSSNGIETEHGYIFDTKDPMIFIELPESGIQQIEILFEVVDYENIAIEREYQQAEKLVEIEEKNSEKELQIKEKQELIDKQKKELDLYEKELDHYKKHYFAAINQREELKRNLENMNRAYNDVLNSQCWKMTKPIRVVLGEIENWLRSHRSTYLIGKGIKSVCTEGIGATAEKVKKYKQISAEFRTYKDEVKAAHRSKQTIECNNENIIFSIVVPLYNTPKDFLKEMIQSVINQTYEEWELCMADGSDSEHGYVGRICEKYAASEKRIKYKHLEKNGGISENTNEALKMATGQYIGLFDHDDLLHPSALYEYMKVITERNADFIYCDENKFEKIDDKFFDPNFKPDFDLDYLRANNYICHFSVFSHTLLDQVGKFRKEYDGSQDHDRILRLTEQANEIVRIPKVLYHWRCSKFSVASNPDAKPYTAESGIKAVNEHLRRCGLNGYAESSSVHPNVYRLHYEIKGNPLISIIIPNKDHIVDLSRCIDSILQKSTYLNYEIIIVENNSTQKETFEYYEKIQKKDNIQVKVYETHGEFNYSAINNFGVKYAKGEHILFLNNDIEIISNSWLEEMLMFSQREDVGAVGAKLYYPNNTIQHAGVILGIGGVAGHSHKYFDRSATGYMSRCFIQQDLSAVTAACLMMKKSVFEQVNGLDEENFKVAFNDVDLCMKIRKAGYLIVWTPYAEAYHYESISRGTEDTPEKQARFKGEAEAFMIKWKKELELGDPYYNQNLTLEREDFSIN